MHSLSSDTISFSMAIWPKCLERSCCFSSKTFMKQLASHISGATLQLKFLGVKFFFHPSWSLKHFLGKVVKFFAYC